jgi:hypothetical protein
MAAQKVFEVGYHSWSASQITGVTNSQFMQGGQLQPFFSDGDIYAQFAWLENIMPEATVTTSDLSWLVGKSIGDTAALLQKMPQRAAGAGKAAGSTALLMTWVAGTMFAGGDPQVTQQGANTLALNFKGISADGTTCPVAMSLAAAGAPA